jgi:hypothetical protein
VVAEATQITKCSGRMMNTPGTHQSPGLVRIIGAIALVIVLAVGGSAAIAGFLIGWGRHGNPDSRRPQAKSDRGRQPHCRAELVVGIEELIFPVLT